jgi:outer membrane protein W
MPRKFCTCLLAAILLVTTAASIASAQNLVKRSRIELGLGLATDVGTEATVSGSGIVTSTELGGPLGSIGFSRWLSEDFAVTISVGALAVDISSDVGIWGSVSTHTAVISMISLGGRYYFPRSTYGEKWRPYAGLAIGPVIGSETETKVGYEVVAKSSNQTAFGGRLAAGIDIQLSRLFMLGLSSGYHLMTDFPEPVGTRKNYNGADFGLSISLLLGKITP